MSTFSDRELKWTLVVGVVLAALGLICFLIGIIPHEPTSYWDEYFIASKGGGILLIVFGLAIAGLAAGHRYTSFFDTTRGLDAGVFAAMAGGVVLATILAIAMALSQLPPPDLSKVPPDPGVREQVVQAHKRLQQMTILALLAAGGVIVSFPARRFFGH